jgi:hypothetical protein
LSRKRIFPDRKSRLPGLRAKPLASAINFHPCGIVKPCQEETLAKRFEPQIYADNTDQKKIEQKLTYFLMFNPRSSAEICGSSSFCKRFKKT